MGPIRDIEGKRDDIDLSDNLKAMDNDFVGRFEKTSEAVVSVGRVASDGGNHRAMSYALLSADERVAAVRLAVMLMRGRFGVPVEVVRCAEDVRDARASRAIRSGEDVKGWCDTRSGKVCLYAPNIESEQDARSEYMHEVIAHKGMRGLLGEERYNELCERLGAVLTDEQRQVVEEYAGSNDSVLGDEYIARIAEELIDDRGEIKEPTVWAKIQAIVREIFRAALGLELTDADIHYMLWRSSERLRSGQADMTQRAQDVETERKLRDAVTRMRPEEPDYGREIRHVTEIELSGGSPYATDAAAVQPLSDAPNNSISLAKLLKNVRMSYAETGKDASEAEFLLDESRKRDEEGLQVEGEGTLMTREGTNDEYVVLRPNPLKPATGDMGSYDRANDGIRFAIGHKRKEDMRKGLMSKLANATDEQVERTISEIEKLGERSKRGGDSKVEKAAYHWVQRGAILLPEDADKVLQAVRMADKYKVDVSKYDCPQQLIDEYLPRQQAGERIDPDKVKTLTNKQVVGDTGITIYNVANGEQGRKDMRKIINTHFGKSASPWCLLQGDGEGNLTPISKSYWKKYSAYPKRVAFKDGKLLAFFASDDKPIWWDRQDRPYVGIPVDGKIPNDELGRFGTIEYDEDGGVRGISNFYRGNKRDGLYEEWRDHDTKRCEQYFKNGQADGICRAWYTNGRLMLECNYKEDLVDGISKSWNFNGQLDFEGEYKKGKRVGIHKTWWPNGQLHAIEEYKDGKLDGLRREWYILGELESEQYFKNGYADGLHREWYTNGQLAFECNYKGSERKGIYRAWHINGQIREESHYSNGRLDCLYGRWSEKGRLLEGSGLSAPDAVKTSQRAMSDGRHQQLSFDFGEDEELAASSPEVAVREDVRPRGRGR